eukprot:SAG11_NODE_460_length_9258_cov_3.010698_5_plen_299_part_00
MSFCLVSPLCRHISFCGDIDIVGHQKPQSRYRTVLWDISQIEMAVHRPPGTDGESVSRWYLSFSLSLARARARARLFHCLTFGFLLAPRGWPDEVQSWTWDGHEGTPMQVRVFTKCAGGQVSLQLNGQAVAGSPAPINRGTEFTAQFRVPYTPGNLTASCATSSAQVAAPSKTFITAKAPAKLVVSADRTSIDAYRGDLSYVTVMVVDAEGHPVPEVRVEVNFAVSGDGELAAVGSGDPTDVSSFHVPKRTTWQGKAVAVLRPTTTVAGSIRLTATAAGLTPGSVVVTTTPRKLLGLE